MAEVIEVHFSLTSKWTLKNFVHKGKKKKISSDKTRHMHNQNKMHIENPCLAFYPLTGGSRGNFMGIKH